MDKINRNTYTVAAIALVIILGAIYFLFIFQKGPQKPTLEDQQEEVKELAEIELIMRPFVTLTPTTDGAEIIISIENMSYFDKIEYELTYMADNPQASGEKIQRGSTGTDVNTREAKYKKSILLGTASRGVRSPDKGVEDGNLALHMFKGQIEYQSETPWKLIQAGAKVSKIEDQSGNFQIQLPALGKDLFIILAETIGLPQGDKEFKVENVVLPIYGSFSVSPKFPKSAKISITLENDTTSPVIYSFNHQNLSWQKLEGQYDQSAKTLNTSIDQFATFVVVSSK